jgi:hypothetical protein
MFDFSTGGKIGVESTDSEQYIVVCRQQVTAVCEVLAAHRVSHTLAGFVPDPFRDEDPIEAVIGIGLCRDHGSLQEILDSVP